MVTGEGDGNNDGGGRDACRNRDGSNLERTVAFRGEGTRGEGGASLRSSTCPTQPSHPSQSSQPLHPSQCSANPCFTVRKDGTQEQQHHSYPFRVVKSSNGLSTLKAAPHQVAGHLFERGKAGSLIDDMGHFYKPLQPGPRGEREETFYRYVSGKKRAERDLVMGRGSISGKTSVNSPMGELSLCSRRGGHLNAVVQQRQKVWVSLLERLLEENAGFEETMKEALKVLGYDVDGALQSSGLRGGSDTSSYQSSALGIDLGLDHRELLDNLPTLREGQLEDELHGQIGVQSPEQPQEYPNYVLQRFPTFSRGASELYEGRFARQPPMYVMQSDESGLLSSGRGVGQGRRRSYHLDCGDLHDDLAHLSDLECLTTRCLDDDELEWSDDDDTHAFPSLSLVGLQSTPHLDLRELPFTLRNAPLLKAIPKFYGTVEPGRDARDEAGIDRVITDPQESRVLMELEDVARMYDRPAIMDVKVGMQTWYDHAPADYIVKCKEKDANTTQSSLGFKICGMQVYRHSLRGFWRASKQWCKTLTEASVDTALESFVHNEGGLRPVDVYGGPHGVLRQLEQLEQWASHQTEFRFFSSSVLILYEGGCSLEAEGDEERGDEVAANLNVSVRLVDFAHTFVHELNDLNDMDSMRFERDENFLKGLRGLRRRLLAICNRDS